MRPETRSAFEKIVLFLALVIATGAGLGAYVAKQQGGTGSAYDYNGGNHVIQLIFSSLYLYFFFRLAKRRQEAWALVKQEKWLAAFWLWAFLSASWSISTSLTLVHWIALLGTGMVGLYIAMQFEPAEQLDQLAICLGTVAVASLIVGIMMPSIGVAPGGAWQGVFFPKNSLGRMMALSTLCFLFLTFGRRGKRWILLPMAALSAGLLLLSQSATAIVVCAFMLALLPFRKLLALGNRLLIPLIAFFSMFAVPLVVWVVSNSKTLLDILGRDNSLTGRLPLWAIILEEIASQPIFGFGYGAFWNSGEADRIRDTIGWRAPNAHNGFLEVLLGLGLVGGTFFLIGLLRNLVLAVRAARGAEPEESWPLFFLIFNLLYSLTESSLLTANFILTMLFVANSYSVVRARVESEQAEDTDMTDDVCAESLSYESLEA